MQKSNTGAQERDTLPNNRSFSFFLFTHQLISRFIEMREREGEKKDIDRHLPLITNQHGLLLIQFSISKTSFDVVDDDDDICFARCKYTE